MHIIHIMSEWHKERESHRTFFFFTKLAVIIFLNITPQIRTKTISLRAYGISTLTFVARIVRSLQFSKGHTLPLLLKHQLPIGDF